MKIVNVGLRRNGSSTARSSGAGKSLFEGIKTPVLFQRHMTSVFYVYFIA
jgi:hypothetical protein